MLLVAVIMLLWVGLLLLISRRNARDRQKLFADIFQNEVNYTKSANFTVRSYKV